MKIHLFLFSHFLVISLAIFHLVHASHLFQCRMYWQKNGDFLAVKVERYTKSKKVPIFDSVGL